MQSALQRQEVAAKTLEDAEEELASLKEALAGPANTDVVSRAVVAEARALLQMLETAPLCSTSSNNVVPEVLLAQMRKLRQTLLGNESDDVEVEQAGHVDTGDEFEDEDRKPGRCRLRGNSRKRDCSTPPTDRRRTLSSSQTPLPSSVLRR